MSNDCVPTAGANIVMYWDSHGYPNMAFSNDWTNVADRLGLFMNHNNTGGVNSSNVTAALDRHFDERGYTGFSQIRDSYPTFTDARSMINRGHPSLLRLSNYRTMDPSVTGGHMVTLVGYETFYNTISFAWSQQIIVHDNWSTTPVKVWLKWSDEPITDLWEIHN